LLSCSLIDKLCLFIGRVSKDYAQLNCDRLNTFSFVSPPPNWIDPIEPVKNTCCQEARTHGNNLGLKKEGRVWGEGERGREGVGDYFLANCKLVAPHIISV